MERICKSRDELKLNIHSLEIISSTFNYLYRNQLLPIGNKLKLTLEEVRNTVRRERERNPVFLFIFIENIGLTLSSHLQKIFSDEDDEGKGKKLKISQGKFMYSQIAKFFVQVRMSTSQNFSLWRKHFISHPVLNVKRKELTAATLTNTGKKRWKS